MLTNHILPRFLSLDQIMYQGTCSGHLSNAIVGGTGVYCAARGAMMFTGKQSQTLNFELHVCHSAC
jgi:hypothetical protein